MADKYMLRVTAGSDYVEANQKLVHVNTEQPLNISNSKLDASLTVRIQNYLGEPVHSPSSCAYFEADPHKSDLYSISFSFTPKKNINGHDLVFGNDFDHPIKDKLPPGFGQAMKIAQWFIDPGLYGDAYADEPYLYGPFLSSINTLRVGEKKEPAEVKGSQDKPAVVSEGADGDGVEARKQAGLPDEASARKKYFLKEQHLKDFTFEEGRNYSCDFFNPYLDFNDFALKLPGFSYIPGITIPIISYWDGQPLRARISRPCHVLECNEQNLTNARSHALRYVLKDRSTNEVLFVIIFTLLPRHSEGQKEEAKKVESSGQKDEDLD
ncbi:DUF1769-domain-containing protein [Aureobasidium subglaciale]|nr:DUF1769-domain-containing protein [Aureobasidium subglaciale]